MSPLQRALGALADIATGKDMTLALAQSKARRVHDELAQAAVPEATPTPDPLSGRTHELKTDPAVFDAVAEGRKTFEIRLNDRGFAVGDVLVLRKTRYTGHEMKASGRPLVYEGGPIRKVVGYMLTGPIYGLEAGWSILGFASENALDMNKRESKEKS